MNCPNIEEIILFSIQNEHANIETATHIYGCRSCQHRLRVIAEFVITQRETVTEEEQKEVLEYLSWKLSPPLWGKLQKLVNDLSCSTFSDVNEFIYSAFPSIGLGDDINLVASATNGENSNIPFFYDGETFEIAFESVVSNDDSSYWYASMSIASGVKPESKILITVSDKWGNPILNAVLTILGIPLPVKYGVAEISFAQIQENILNTMVNLQKKEEPSVDGVLKIC